MKRGARFEAIQNGEGRYLGEKPCKRGHTGWRTTLTGTCIECRQINSRERYKKDPAKNIAKVREYYWLNAEERKRKRRERYAADPQKENIGAKERTAEWRKNNPEKLAAHKVLKQRYKANNPGKVNADTAKRRTAKMKRTPLWLSEDDKWMIEQAYELAALRTQMFGFSWHVDHMLPLQGKEVSGLHVPQNLQVIPWIDNLSKANKFSEARSL